MPATSIPEVANATIGIAANAPLLGSDAIRRICRGLIRAEQLRRLQERRISLETTIILRDPASTNDQIDALHIDEATMGFDSISILDLILVVNRFFGLDATGIEDYLFVQRRVGDWVSLIAKHLEITGETQRFGFMTSGSSGTPKTISHGIAELRTECLAQIDGPFGLIGIPERVITAVPAHHIFGFLFSGALPHLLGCPVVDCADLPPTSILRQTRPGDLIIGTPWNWQNVANLDQRFPAHVTGIVSAGPSDPSLWHRLGASGLSGLTEVYGASETGGIGWRVKPEHPFTLLSHLQRSADGITGITLKNTPDQLLPLQDKLHWHDTFTFDLAGRHDGVLQVGGVNVSPEHVRHIAMAVAGIADAAVRLQGDRLKAFIVPDDTDDLDRDALETRLRQAFAMHLAAPARPQSICFGPALPRNAMGKLCDWTLVGAGLSTLTEINSK